MLGGGVGRHSGIHETNQIGERVVAEEEIHFRLIFFIPVNGVELIGRVIWQSSGRVGREVQQQIRTAFAAI